MELIYKGKNAIVTGASGGMGLEISKMLSENNINVLMLDIQNPSKSFLNENINCTYKKVDVTNFRKLKSIIQKYFKENKSIDYLINTTGVLWFNKDVSSNIYSNVYGQHHRSWQNLIDFTNTDYFKNHKNLYELISKKFKIKNYAEFNSPFMGLFLDIFDEENSLKVSLKKNLLDLLVMI